MLKFTLSFLSFLWLQCLLGQTQIVQTYYDKSDSVLKELIHWDPKTQKINGTYLKFHQNGSKSIEGYYNQNLPDSLWTFYFESGVAKSSGHYKLGEAVGLWKYYYENGNLKSTGSFHDGLQDSSWIHFYENGKIKQEAQYQNGNEIGKWSYYFESGPIKASTQYDSLSIGFHLEYTLDGTIKAQGQKAGLKSTGKWSYYYPDGQLESRGTYYNGNKEGVWINYYKNGNIKSSGIFVNGLKTGKWTYYHSNGSLQSEGQMTENLQDGQWKMYASNGTLQSYGKYAQGTGPVTTYHSNGQVASIGLMLAGKRDSIWTYYDETGQQIASAKYNQDEGNYTGYYPDGSIRLYGSVRGNKRIGEWKIYNERGDLTGTYHPIYSMVNSNLVTDTDSEIPDTVETPDLTAEISEYKYQKKENRYFDEVVNEYDGWIIGSNPLMTVWGRLPIGIEKYHQERLGYELIYESLRTPFVFNDNNIDTEELYHQGHSISFRQKLYSKSIKAGMYYFGHQLQSVVKNHHVKTMESGGFRTILISSAQESVFSYGWMIGWKIMSDPGENGWVIDGYIGQQVGLRTWQYKKIEDEAAYEYFSTINQERFALPFSFGLNIGWSIEQKRKKRK